MQDRVEGKNAKNRCEEEANGSFSPSYYSTDHTRPSLAHTRSLLHWGNAKDNPGQAPFFLANPGSGSSQLNSDFPSGRALSAGYVLVKGTQYQKFCPNVRSYKITVFCRI